MARGSMPATSAKVAVRIPTLAAAIWLDVRARPILPPQLISPRLIAINFVEAVLLNI